MTTFNTPNWESNEKDGRVLFNQFKAEVAALDIAASQNPVKDKDLTAPPVSPSVGDRYIVAGSATGAWAGKSTNIAMWNGTAWDFIVPFEGFRVFVQDEDKFYLFDGTSWAVDVVSQEVAMTTITGSETITGLNTGTATEITVEHSGDATFEWCEYPHVTGPLGVRVTVLALSSRSNNEEATEGDSTTESQFVLLIENVNFTSGYPDIDDIVLDWSRIGKEV